MKSNFFYGMAMFSLFLMASLLLGGFLVMFLPFDYVQVKKLTPVKKEYKPGESLEKKLLICKTIDTPVSITLEISNADIILLTQKESYAKKGCKEYLVSQAIPLETKGGPHRLIVTVSYHIIFRTIHETFESDLFDIRR